MSKNRLILESMCFLRDRILALEQSVHSLDVHGDTLVVSHTHRRDRPFNKHTFSDPDAHRKNMPANKRTFSDPETHGKDKPVNVRTFSDPDTHDESRFHPVAPNELVPNEYEQVELKKGQRFWKEKHIAVMVKQFNDYWFLLTGRHIHFVFYVENQPYVSLSAPSRHAWVCVRRLFPHRPIVVDPFGGVATEGLSAIFEACAYRYFWVNDTDSLVTNVLAPYQRPVAVKASRGVPVNPAPSTIHNIYEVAKANIDNFLEAFPELKGVVDVQYAQNLASVFLTQTNNKIFDCVFLDPPWFKDGYDMSAATEVMDFLKKEIFDIISSKGFVVVVYMIKMRFGKAVMEQLVPKYLPGYRLLYTIYATPLRNTYAYHIIISEKPEALRWQKDVIFDNVYKLYDDKHERQRIPVGKDGKPVYIGPVTPDQYYRFPPTVPVPFVTYDPSPDQPEAKKEGGATAGTVGGAGGAKQ